MPLVSVNVRVVPIVKGPASCIVPPTPSITTGKSSVLPLVVMVFVPEVEAKVVVLVPAVSVIVADNV